MKVRISAVKCSLIAAMGCIGLLSICNGYSDGVPQSGSAIDQILSRASQDEQGDNNDILSSASNANADKEKARQQLVQSQLKQAQSVDLTPEQVTEKAKHYDLYPGDSKKLSQKAFDNMIRSTTPMTPDQIRLLHSMLDKSRRATAQPAGLPPKASSSSVLVNMAPGASPPVVRLRDGYVTSVIFIDATGQPWPIKAYDLGNSSIFNIHWDQKGNTLMIQANSDYQQGNLAVLLRGMNTPVMITLIPGQQAVDYRVDMRIPRLGPNGTSAVAGLPGTADPRLLDVLDGIPPTASKQLLLSMSNSEAWLQGKTMFLRTPLSVLSPGWSATVRSDDGMRAYALQPTPVILVMQHGKITKLTVKGF